MCWVDWYVVRARPGGLWCVVYREVGAVDALLNDLRIPKKRAVLLYVLGLGEKVCISCC